MGQETGWASTAVIVPRGGGGVHPRVGGGNGPQGRPITTSKGGAVPCSIQQQNQKIIEKLNPKTHPKDVVDRPALGVRDPRGSITGWKGGRVESRADRER